MNLDAMRTGVSKRVESPARRSGRAFARRPASAAILVAAMLAVPTGARSGDASSEAPAQPAPAQPEQPEQRPRTFRFEFQYLLADVDGILPLPSAFLSYDPKNNELYAAGDGEVRIFNRSGMQTYTFGEDPELGHPHQVAPLESGELLVLAYDASNKTRLVRCNFRGRVLGPVELHGVPDGYGVGDTMVYANGKVYLFSTHELKALVVDPQGNFLAKLDLAELIGVKDELGSHTIGGFAVDADGNVVFTVPTLFKVFIVSPEGGVTSFGSKGSSPGKFNLAWSVARDAEGYIYVADKLRSVIMIFDRQFKFVSEFGFRGFNTPTALLLAGDRIFVSQVSTIGVNVFRRLPETP